MNTLYGMNVIVSPLIQDDNKIRFNCGIDTPTISAFNRWLRDTFGTKPTYLVMHGNQIVTNKRGLDALNEAIAKGGA